MGMYTGLRGWVEFNPAVAETLQNWYSDEITDEVVESFNYCHWKFLASVSGLMVIHEFAKNSRASFIPNGSVAYMPVEWGENSRVFMGDCLHFTCSLKNYSNTIEDFIDLLPHIAVRWDLESLYEEDDTPVRYYQL